jgi:hypothetical protein
VGESNSAWGQIAGRSKIVNTLIEEKVANATQHATTPAVATDMLRIVKAHGFGKSKLPWNIWAFQLTQRLDRKAAVLGL